MSHYLISGAVLAATFYVLICWIADAETDAEREVRGRMSRYILLGAINSHFIAFCIYSHYTK